MQNTNPNQLTLLNELEARQDDVLSQLDELNARIELVLKELTATPSDSLSAKEAREVNETTFPVRRAA